MAVPQKIARHALHGEHFYIGLLSQQVYKRYFQLRMHEILAGA